jgi:PPK2 family polyphosphate:nucleotide phosphotransferase
VARPSDNDAVSPPKIDLGHWRVKGRVQLHDDEAGLTPGAVAEGSRSKNEAATRDLRERFRALQDRMSAQSSQSLLVVLQAMDTGGKDGTVKNIYAAINPGCASVVSYSVPTEEERAHDFLWRIHAKTPGKGSIAIFNRSHYEDVLAVRVRNIAPPSVWQPRYALINQFEENLVAGGTTIVKLMLHISKEEQRERLQARIDRPEKRWKFRMGDLEDRALWDDYKRAYQDTIAKTNTPNAPWYVIPSDRKWYRDFAVMNVLVATLEAMKPEYPEHKELDGIVIP